MSKKNKNGLDWRAILQGLVGFILAGLVTFFGTCIKQTVSSVDKTVTNVQTTIDSHSKVIEKIPGIESAVGKVDNKVDGVNKKVEDSTHAIWGAVSDLNKKVDVEAQTLNTKVDAVQSSQSDFRERMAHEEGIQEGLKQHQATPPSPPK